jgi:cell division protein FtsQ
MAAVLALPFRVFGFAASRPWGRRALALLAAAVVLGCGYRLWLRDSSLFAVRSVKVDGLSAANASRVRLALTGQALEMTTLHVRMDALHDAVRPYPTVRTLSIDRHFPHGLTIHVTEQQPASVIRAGGRTIPIAPDGAVLAGIETPDGLPEIAADSAPSGRTVRGAELDQALVLGAAPAELRSRVRRSLIAQGGVAVKLDDGVRLYFGDPVRVHAKWDAATRVLADPRIDQLTYIDLTVPERPAVGGTGAPPPSDPATVTPAPTAGATAYPAPTAPVPTAP